MLISLLVVLAFSIADLSGSARAAWAAAGVATPTSRHVVQARAKKKAKRPRQQKAKTATKKTEKQKKNDRGFEL